MSQSYYLLLGKDAQALYKVSQDIGAKIHAFSRNYGLITPLNNPLTQIEATANRLKINEMDFNKVEEDEEIIKVLMVEEEEVLAKSAGFLPKALYEKYTIVRSTPCNKQIHTSKDFLTGVSKKPSGKLSLRAFCVTYR